MKKELLSIMMALVAMIIPTNSWAQTVGDETAEPYAVLSQNNTVLTFYYDDQKAARNGMSVGPFYGSNNLYEQRESITNVVFDASFANCTTLTSTAHWFDGLKNLSTITGISNLKTNNVTSMYCMFRDCSSLTSLDVSNFKTDNVTNMDLLFYGCSSLTSLDVSNFKTDNVWDMGNMFYGCSSLTSLDVSNFKTDNVEDMHYMFSGCSGLTSLDLSNFKTNKVTHMYGMFRNCSGLTSLDLSNFNTTNVTDMSHMFNGCSSLTSLEVSNFKTDNVTNMGWMFEDCSGLTNLDLSNFKTDNVEGMNNMFEGCSGLTSISVTGFKTDKVTSMWSMFEGCSGLTNLDLSNFKTDNVEGMGYMFYGCSGLRSLDLSGFNTGNVTGMGGMFDDCSSLKTIYASSEWNTSKVENGESMFHGCTNLVGGAGTKYDATHTDYTYAHIDGGTNNPGYFTAAGAEPWAGSEPIVVSLINNGDMEGDDNGNFFVRYEAMGDQFKDVSKATITNGVGVNGSRGVKVEAKAKMVEKWDNQFWFRLNQPVSAGTKVRLSFDYHANTEATITTESHEEPSVYINENPFGGDINFSEEWSHFEYEGTMDSYNSTDQLPFQSMAFTLNSYFEEPNNYYFDNVKFEVIMEDQCPKPTFKRTDNNVTIQSPFDATIYYTLDGKEPTTNSSVYTAPLSFTQNTTIKAIAVVEGYEASPVAIYLFEPAENNLDQRKEELRNMITQLQQEVQDCERQLQIIQSGDISYLQRQLDDIKTAIMVVQERTEAATTEAELDECEENIIQIAHKLDELRHEIEHYSVLPDPEPYEPYAVLSQNNTVLTFYYDDQKAARNGMDIEEYTLWWDSEIERATTYSGWDDERENITNVVFDASFANCTTLTSTAFWFYGFTSLTSITGITNLKTDNMTDIGSMFENCSSLTSIDISRFNTSKVTNMSRMFSGCSSLTSLDLRGFNTTNVIYFNAMFLGCSALTNLDLSNFNTANAKNMSELFEGCSGLTTLNVIGFKTDNVTSMDYMFYRCSNLTSLDLSNFNTANVISMNFMFYGCSNLTSLDLSNFITGNVDSIAEMFHFCSGLTTIYVGDGWSTEKLTNGGWMFDGCTRLVGGRGTRYDPDHVNADYAHIDGGANNPGYFTGVDNSLVAYYPFNGNANDESGHGNNGTPMETVTLTTGVHGDANGAYQFGGTDNPGSIHVPNSESLQIGDKWSFATYVKPLSYAGMDFYGLNSDNGVFAIFGHDHDQHGFSIQYIVTENDFHTWIGHYGGGWNEGIEATVNGKYMNKWIHVAYTYANNTFRIYINGRMISEMNATPDFAEANLKDWYFGKYDDAWYPLNGLLDEIRIYNRELSANEVSELARYADAVDQGDIADFDGLTAWVSGGATLDDAFAEAGGREEAAKTIAAIIWENTTALTADMLQGINNPNLLVYVNEARLAPQGIQNVIINGQAKEIILTDTTSGNNNFFCPQLFMAEKISYTRNFRQQTEIGISRGWEGIALPFTVQSITHETKGTITPFGSGNGKHFWLRAYDGENMYSAHEMEAYAPYVIAMPNSNAYYADYNLNGRVTFSATNTEVYETPDFSFLENEPNMLLMTIPAFQTKVRSERVYAINVGQARGNHAEGSVFEQNLREVRPFEVYTVHNGQGARPRFIPIKNQTNGESTGIVSMENGEWRIENGEWFGLDGHKLSGKPQKKGVYIQKGKKIMVK